ncbi:hypothetical protein ASG94_20705 [Nocardioides sp. Soil805]|nr:hypothetical protein ASG94_20705 [Nocardioides sp. Soil805]
MTPSASEPSASETSVLPTPSGSATSEPAPSSSAMVEAETTDVEAEADEGGAGWWWLLAGLVLALVAGVLLWSRARRRGAGRAELTAAEGEVSWLARELLPDLRDTGSREQVAGGWAVSSDRVVALEDRLTRLEATAKDEQVRGRARELRDAVRVARTAMADLLHHGAGDVRVEIDDLVAALEAGLDRPVRAAP